MSTRTEIAALKVRWTPEALSAADRAFTRMDPVASYQGRPPPHPFVSPFGEHKGRADFRYLPLGVIPAYRRFEQADLTGATDERNGQLCCSLIDCLVDRASMETNLGEKLVQNTSFVNAKFSHTSLRGQFIDCDFSNTNLTYSGAAQGKFTRCNFSGAKFVGARLQYCLFDNCIWTDAKLGNVAFGNGRFIGSCPSADQLADAMYPKATFEGC